MTTPLQTQHKTFHTHTSHLSIRYIKIYFALVTLQETPPSPTTPPSPPPQQTSPITRCYKEMTSPLQTQPKTLHTHTFHNCQGGTKRWPLHWQHYKRHPPTPTKLIHHKELHRDDHSTAETTKYPIHTHFTPVKVVHKDGL